MIDIENFTKELSMKQNILLSFSLLLGIPQFAQALVGPVMPGQNLWCISRDINLTAQTILDQLSTFTQTCAGSCNIIPLSQSNVVAGNLVITASGHYCLQEDITLATPSDAIFLNDSTIYLDLNNRCVNGSIVINGNFDTVTNGVILAPVPSAISAPNQAAVTINADNCEVSECIITTADVVSGNLPSRNGVNNVGQFNIIRRCIIKTGQAHNGGFALTTQNSGDGILSTGNNTKIFDCSITTSNGASVGFFGGGSQGGNGGNGLVLTSTQNTVENCIINTGNGSNAAGTIPFMLQPNPAGNGGFGIWIQSSAVDCLLSNNLIASTGLGGVNTDFTSGTGQSGHGIQIDNGAQGIEVVNNIFSNTGTFTGTPESVANKGGLAVNDLTTTTTNSTFIYGNFAYNIAQDTPNKIRYKIHNSVTEAGVESPNPPDASLINFIANVFTE